MIKPYWKTQRRETSLIEHQCPHGVGHPNFYSAVRLSGYSTDPEEWGFLAHGCCAHGCCMRDDFLGRRQANWELMLRPYAVWNAVYGSEVNTIPVLAEYEGEELCLYDLGSWLQYTFHDIFINDLLDGKIDEEITGMKDLTRYLRLHRERYPIILIEDDEGQDVIKDEGI